MMAEIMLSSTDLLVSETDVRGVIRYANDDFCRIAEYAVDELEGQAHNIVRHEDMPKAAFKDLWDTIKAGRVWHGFVKNKTKNNNFYWVFATVYPYTDSKGQEGYMSVRKMASREEVQVHEKLYVKMMQEER
jgi:aerotaxis receptor